ncbi:hypothetical protein STENM223S_03338 [Streptomyces tendae]
MTGTARGIRRATHAHGAGESGLGKLIELHGVNGAGDVMITVALASTVFFSVPTDEARGRVALLLAITMAPFTLLAPVIGPLLDRLPHGRRGDGACGSRLRGLCHPAPIGLDGLVLNRRTGWSVPAGAARCRSETPGRDRRSAG